jgi:hypothetical protein
MQGGPARRRGAVDQDDTRSADNHCLEYLRAKKKETRKSGSVPTPGCCIPMVLHRCGDEKGAVP